MLKVFILSVFFCFTPSVVHDFHLSKCDINYSLETNTVQLSIHLFLDDLETSLAYEKGLKLFEQGELPQADSLINAYLDRHLQILHDKKLVNLVYIGKEMSDDLSAVYVYLEGEFEAMPKEVEVKNDLLIPQFDDQQNMLTIRKNGSKFFHSLLYKGKESAQTTF